MNTATMVQNSHVSKRKYWATRSSVHLHCSLTHSRARLKVKDSNRPGIECTRCWKALSALEEVELKWFHYNKDQPGHR